VKRTSIVAIALLLVSCGGGPSRDGRDDTTDSHPIDRLIAESFGTEQEPGLAVMVVKDGEVIFQRTRGVANVDTGEAITPQSNFRLASITKHISALAVLMLADQGRLDLDAPLVDLFPGFPAIGADITPRMLVHHTSGLIDYESLMGIDEPEPTPLTEAFEQVMDADVLELTRTTDSTYFTPGTEYRYSNTGYALLALLVEQASGVSFPQFLKHSIFDPLRMTDTLAYAHDDIDVPRRVYGHSRTDEGWVVADQSPTSAVLGDGGVYSSLADLERWFEFLDGNNTLELSEQAYEAYLSPGVFGDGSALVMKQDPAAAETQQPLRTRSYGYGWFFGEFLGVPVMHHGGGTMGFRHMLARNPDKNVTVVLLTNRNEADIEFLNQTFGYFLVPAE